MNEFVKYSVLLEQELVRRRIGVERIHRTKFKTEFGDVFDGTTISPQSTLDLIKNKARTKTILREAGIPTPDWYVLKCDEEPEFRFDEYPVFVKPNEGSLAQGITVALDKHSFRDGVRRVYKLKQDALIEKLAKGIKWRVFATAERHLSNVKYLPLTVVGDGRTRLYDLVRERDSQRRYHQKRSGSKATLAPTKPDWEWLARHQIFMHSKISKGETIELSEVVARATGGISVEMGKIAGFDIAARAVALIPELHWSALDVIQIEDDFTVIEMNGHSYFRQHLEPERGEPEPFIKELIEYYLGERTR